MKKNVCFVANYAKTFLFHEITQQLAFNEINIYWIVTNKKMYNFLLKYYKKENILYINLENIKKDNKIVCEFKLNEIVYGDRSLKYNIDEGIKFLENIQYPIYNFIKINKIKKVFGEITWAHELLIYRICLQKKELDCIYLNPHTIRVPNGYFAFFKDEYQCKIYKKNDLSLTQNKKDITIEKPDYLELNNQILKEKRKFIFRLKRLCSFLCSKNKDTNDPTMIQNKFILLKIRIKEELNKELYRFVKTNKLSDFKDKKILFYALHKQPEASIDVIGRYAENQYLNIINLWRVLPSDWIIIVKEHTNAIGDRDLKFYKKLQAIKGIYFLNETTDSYDIIQKSELIATVSGTVAYEAVLLNKPAITFSKLFFNIFPKCKYLTIEDFKNINSIYDLLEVSNNNEIEKFTNEILEMSFEGTVSDPESDIRCINKDNIKKLTNAFLRVI